MSDSMQADSAALRDSACTFRYVSLSVADTFERLSGVLDVAGNCWGSDEVGRTFAESYVPGVQLVRDALPTLRDDVADVGEAVVAAADNVDAADDRAESRLT